MTREFNPREDAESVEFLLAEEAEAAAYRAAHPEKFPEPDWSRWSGGTWTLEEARRKAADPETDWSKEPPHSHPRWHENRFGLVKDHDEEKP